MQVYRFVYYWLDTWVLANPLSVKKNIFFGKKTTFQKIHRTESPQFTEQNRHNSPNETATIHRTEPPQFTEHNRHNSPNFEEEFFIKLLNITKL